MQSPFFDAMVQTGDAGPSVPYCLNRCFSFCDDRPGLCRTVNGCYNADDFENSEVR